MFNKANTTYTVYRLFLVFFALVILFTASQAFAIHIYLKGGNVLVGKLPETLPFSTPKYNIKVKTNEIVSFRNGNLRLKNGSVLQKATIGLEELQVQTKFGNISIKVEEIEIIEEKIFVPTRNKEHNPTTNKYLVVTNKKGITFTNFNKGEKYHDCQFTVAEVFPAYYCVFSIFLFSSGSPNEGSCLECAK